MKPFSVRLVGAAVSGLAAGLSFEPFGLVFLLPLAVAGVTVCVLGARPARGFWLGTVFGFVFMLVLVPWLRVIGSDAWVGLSLLEAVLYGVGGLATAAVTRLRGWPVWAAAVWVGMETLRATVPFGGFPWGRLAFASIDTPVAPWAAYIGAAGTSFVVALVGTSLAWAAVNLRPAPARSAVGAGAAVALVALGAVLPLPAVAAADGSGSTLVAAVQGDVPGEGMNPFSERRAVLDNHVQATLDLAARVDAGAQEQPDLVIWPENSTDIDPFTDPTVYADIQSAVDAIGVPILVGAMVRGERPGDVFNQGIVWQPGSGAGQSYSKRHPVPFGEYIPFRRQLAPYISRLDQIPRDMVAGSRPGVLEMNGTTVGDVICFEVAYDEVVRDVAQEADVLVVQTNNATYMGTGQVEQQFAISRLRAIETGLPVVVAATNGITGIVAPDGSVLDQAPVRTSATLMRSLATPDGVSWGLRTGLVVQLLLVGAGALATAAGLLVGDRRSPRSGRPTQRTSTTGVR